MDLAEMLSILWKSKWIILVTALVTGAIVAYQSFREDTVYQAETTLIVSTLNPSNIFGNEDILASSFAELALTEAVQERARDLENPESSSTGTSGISAETRQDSPFLRVTASNAEPDRAVNDANAVAEALVIYVDELQQQSLEEKRETLLAELEQISNEQEVISSAPDADQTRLAALDSVRQSILRQYEELNASMLENSLLVVDTAETATATVSHPLRNTIFGFFLGAVAGVILGFAIESVRKSMRWEP